MAKDLSTANFHRWCENVGGKSTVDRTGPREHTHKCLLRNEGVVHKVVDDDEEHGARYVVEGSVEDSTSLPLADFKELRDQEVSENLDITEIEGITGLTTQGDDRLKIIGGSVKSTVKYKPDIQDRELGDYTVSL